MSAPSADRHDPLTAEGVERAGMWVLVGVRTINAVQLVVGLVGTLPLSPRPWLNVAAAAVFAVSAFIVVVLGLRWRRLPGHFLLLDVATGVLILLVAPLFVAPEHVTTWAAWPFAMTLLSGGVAAAGLDLRWTTISTVALTVSYASWLRMDLPVGGFATVLANAVAYPAIAYVLHFFMRYLRKLAVLADERHVLARRLEQVRVSRALHTPYRLLQDYSTMIQEGAGVSGLDARMRWQLMTTDASVREIEALVQGVPPASSNLDQELHGLRHQFGDLPLSLNVSGLEGKFERELTYRLREAVRSALQNVRIHALAKSVTVFASGDPQGWLVSVHDDGVGFDTAAVTQRMGLGLIVGAVEEVGGRVQITTSPGQGTFIEMAGGTLISRQ